MVELVTLNNPQSREEVQSLKFKIPWLVPNKYESSGSNLINRCCGDVVIQIYMDIHMSGVVSEFLCMKKVN